jgi:hypothetical protein
MLPVFVESFIVEPEFNPLFIADVSIMEDKAIAARLQWQNCAPSGNLAQQRPRLYQITGAQAFRKPGENWT